MFRPRIDMNLSLSLSLDPVYYLSQVLQLNHIPRCTTSLEWSSFWLPKLLKSFFTANHPLPFTSGFFIYLFGLSIPNWIVILFRNWYPVTIRSSRLPILTLNDTCPNYYSAPLASRPGPPQDYPLDSLCDPIRGLWIYLYATCTHGQIRIECAFHSLGTGWVITSTDRPILGLPAVTWSFLVTMSPWDN